MILGQEDLIANVDSMSRLPHSILLVGDRGSSQVDICKYIANKFNLNLTPIPSEIDFDEFKRYIDYHYVTPTLLAIDGDNLGVKGQKQNSILKLFEEPSQFVYIVIYTEDVNNLLETIRTRSYVMNLCRYRADQLIPLITGDIDLTLRVCNTPGQVEQANRVDLRALYKLCNNIINNIDKASYHNSLSISDKTGDDLFLFTRMLGICCIDNGSISIYRRINEMNHKLWLPDINDKKKVIENFVSKLWGDVHGH